MFAKGEFKEVNVVDGGGSCIGWRQIIERSRLAQIMSGWVQSSIPCLIIHNTSLDTSALGDE